MKKMLQLLCEYRKMQNDSVFCLAVKRLWMESVDVAIDFFWYFYLLFIRSYERINICRVRQAFFSVSSRLSIAWTLWQTLLFFRWHIFLGNWKLSNSLNFIHKINKKNFKWKYFIEFRGKQIFIHLTTLFLALKLRYLQHFTLINE